MSPDTAGRHPSAPSLLSRGATRRFSETEQEHKRMFYERMSPRRRKFIDKIGFDAWDPFEGPKDPLDIRMDVTQRTIGQLLNEFLQSLGTPPGGDYARGALECAMGLVNQDEKYRGTLDFCLWYHDLLQKEQRRP